MTLRNQSASSILALCVLIAIAFLTLAWISPPAPQPSDAPPTEFSAGRAMHDLEVVARESHPMGVSPAHAEVRDYLLGEVRALGLEPQVQNTFGVRIWSPGSAYISGGSVENILVRLPGTSPEGAILLMAHYDSSPGVPGAVDSGSAVVTMLDLLRALRAVTPLRQDVIFLFSDGEEPGSIGAQTFVSQHPWFADVRLVINMDQFYVGPPILFLTSGGNGRWVQALARSASSTKPAYMSFPFDLFPTGDTDLVPFIRAGVPGAEFDGGGPFAEKHTSLDRPELVDPGSLQQAGNQILALIQYLGDQPTLEVSVPDQTFFPIMGMIVHYPSYLTWFFSIAAGLCFLGTIVYGTHKSEMSWRGMGLGFLVFLLSITLSVVFTSLIWRGILAFHPEYAYVSAPIFRQKLSGDFLYAIGFIVLTLAFATSSIAIARKKITTLDLATGALFIWLLLMIATTILIPATSYLFTWVLLSASLALLLAVAVRSRNNAWMLSQLGFLTSACLATFLWIPLFYIAILSGPMSPDTPLLGLLVGLSALWLGSMTPILDWISTPKRWLLPAAAWSVALSFLVAGHFQAGKDSPPPLINPIGFWFNADERQAYWVAFSDELDDRQTNLLVDPVQRLYTELFSQAPQYSVLTSAAPILDLDGPRLEVLTHEWVVDHSVLKARITTSMDERILIFLPEELPLLAITVMKNVRTELPPVDDGGWVLRFDGLPDEGIDIIFEFPETGAISFLLVEERTGLPSFPGLLTQPEPGTMISPGVFTQAIPTDFTAINRTFVVPEVSP